MSKMRVEIFRCTESYLQEGSWYDFCLCDFDYGRRSTSYAARLIGVFEIIRSGNVPRDHFTSGQLYAVVQSSKRPLAMKDIEKDFVSTFELGHETSDFNVVDVESIHHPLLVMENYGGVSSEYICCLPRRKWGHFFGRQIRRSRNN